MYIKVLPRIFFESIKNTVQENIILEKYKIISINHTWDVSPPFRKDNLKSQNLLYLFFDDITEKREEGAERCFNKTQAQEFFAFVDKSMPLLIHCTAGISRSGAVGEILNWYFNRFIECNENHFNAFLQNNQQIIPNTLVRKIMLEVLNDM